MKVLVCGAGVVGLACALELARDGHDVVVAERNPAPGQETSSRNSGVIHCGLYYPAGSLKAELCVTGRRRLLAFCEQLGVQHRLCGKLIVATEPEDASAIEALLRKGRENGVFPALQLWSPAKIRARFPNVAGFAGIWSAGSGIVDVHGLVTALARELSRAGGILLLATDVRRVTAGRSGWHVRLGTGGECEDHGFDAVINAAGHGSAEIARTAEVFAPTVYPVKGNYFRLHGPSPADALIYPVPSTHLVGLGVHLTIDMAGSARLGPDVQIATGSDDVMVATERKGDFLRAAQRFLPGLTADQLRPDFAAVRPKLAVDAFADFHIEQPAPGFVQLSGIESPGLTACLAIGRLVATTVGAG